MNKFIELVGYSDKNACIGKLENEAFEANTSYSLLAIKREKKGLHV